MQGFVSVLQLGGFGVRGIGRLAHGGDGLVHSRGDPAVPVHDAGVDAVEHLKEGVHELLRQLVHFFLGAIRDQGARPVVRIFIEPFAFRAEQLIPQAGDIQRGHVPPGFLEGIVQLLLLEKGSPGIGCLCDAFLPALGQQPGRGVHIVDDLGIGLVQTFQQLLSDFADGSHIGDPIGVRDLLRGGDHRFMDIVELILIVAQLCQHRDESVSFFLGDRQILVDGSGIQRGNGLVNLLDIFFGGHQIVDEDLTQQGEVVVCRLGHRVVS